MKPEEVEEAVNEIMKEIRYYITTSHMDSPANGKRAVRVVSEDIKAILSQYIAE